MKLLSSKNSLLLFLLLIGQSFNTEALLNLEQTVRNLDNVPLVEQASRSSLADIATEVSDDEALIVNTKYGRLRGRLNLTLVQRLGWLLNTNKDPRKYPRVFAGIPFAEKPLGKLRFMSPEPLKEAWEGVDASGRPFGKIRDAFHYMPDCSQRFISLNKGEDCLYLNVFVPPADRVNPARPLPVIISIFGGAFYFGGAHEFGFYNGQYMTEHKAAIIVTINHRLNAFGFLTSDRIPANVGIEDQWMAMTWIKENIHAFGGDPDNITLMGISSGATSIAIHMTSPYTPPGLFHRAVMQSNPLNIGMRAQRDVERASVDLARVLGCLVADDQHANGGESIDLACMQAKSEQEILDAIIESPSGPLSGVTRLSDQFAWWPCIDHRIIAEDPLEAFKLGHFNRDIPVIVSSTKDEGALWVFSMTFPLLNIFGFKPPFAPNDFQVAMENYFGNAIDKFKELYPITDTASGNMETYTRLYTDYVFICPTNDMADAIKRHGGKVFAYHFTAKFNTMRVGYCQDRVCHAGDLLLSWRTAISLEPIPPSIKQLSDKWIGYLTNFATTGNPNDGPTSHITLANDKQVDLNAWPIYINSQKSYLRLDTTVESVAPPRAEYCDALVS
ncbi:Carboxylesterase [Syncephalis plumigaleata]|nr:Carboxylesterase [Syncephalis plumigaleata]